MIQLIQWLVICPCVLKGQVVIDTRGIWPTAIIGLKARQIETKQDFVWFLVENLD